LYSLLRTLYTYPLTETGLQAVSQLQVASDSPLAAGLLRMQTALHTDEQPAVTLDELNIEMTRLLEGPGLTPAPPYAAYYLNDKQLMGAATIAARKFYLAWQAVPDSTICLPDDHLALELGFMAHLAQLAAEGNETALIASRDFLRHHLLPWIPQFCTALAGDGNNLFFIGLAYFTQSAIQADLDWLDRILTETTTETVGAVQLV